MTVRVEAVIFLTCFIMIGSEGMPSYPRSPLSFLRQGVSQSLQGLTSAGVVISLQPVLSNAATINPGYILDLPKYEKSVFNLPPSQFIYPDYMEGYWLVDFTFVGGQFSPQYPAELLARNPNIAGFRKYSVMVAPDIGASPKQVPLHFIRKGAGGCYEDRTSNIPALISRFVNNVDVDSIAYDPDSNPNRISAVFRDARSAGKLELFVNDRKVEIFPGGDGYRTLEQCRQSTTRAINGQKATQLIVDYAVEWLVRVDAATNKLNGQFRIFSYLSPNDPTFFERSTLPVCCFQYNVVLSQVNGI
jgi:hypothetical protein